MNPRDHRLPREARAMRRLGYRPDRIARELDVPLWAVLKAIRESQLPTSTSSRPIP
jgi:hypothetical protein